MKRKRPPSRTRGGNPAHLAPIRWSWDKLGTHFAPRKAPQRPPTSGILSPPASCDVRVNADWLAHIIGALETLTQPDAWSERSDWAINQIEILLAALTARIVDSYDCGCDMPYQLRQKPGAPCVLQQSLDGGLNWLDAFDFSLCLRPALQPLISYTHNQTYNQAQTSLTTIVNTYNTTGGGGQTTIETIAPEFVNKAQAAKNLALCQACRDVVDLVCELEIERRNQIGQGVQALALVLGAVAAAFLTAITAGAMTIAGVAVLSAIVEAGATGVGMVSDALLRNTESRQAVACCMYNALKGQSPTKATFSASLGGCGFTETSNNAQLAGAIAPLLADDAVHAAFLNSLNELARWAELGLISCPCDDIGEIIVPFDSPLWTTRGPFTRALAATPVGSFDSFVFDGPLSLNVPGRISRIGISQNIGSPGGWYRIKLSIGGILVGEDIARTNTLGCLGGETWIFEVSPPLSGPITIEGLELLPGSIGSGSIFCAIVTRV